MKKALCLLLSFIMIVSLATSISAIVVNQYNYSATYDEAVLDGVLPQGYTQHGRCGENAYWGYYEDTKTLVIGGKGAHEARDSFNLKYEYWELPFEKAVVQEGITELDACAFYSCESMKEISLPDSLTKIDGAVFKYCKNLKSVTIPKNLSYWGMGNFYYCESLEEIKVDPDNTTFDSRDNCNAIITTNSNQLRDVCKNTIIPESVTNIGSMAYYGVKGITEITIPEHITNIWGQAFEECVDLETVRLHSGVKLGPSGIFSKCKKLKNVYIPEGITSIGMQDFNECTSLESIEIPSSVKWINQSAFLNCTSLKTVTINSGVENIGPGAFAGCTSLEEIVIPKTVTNIYIAVFKDCTALKSVTVYNPECVIGDLDTTFPEDTVIYGYEGSTAQDYAEHYVREFVALPEPEYALGDVDLDGEVSILDATEIQLVLAQLREWKSAKCEELADVDNDGGVSVLDATAIQMMLAGLA